jgi:hypothetical protein
MSNDAEIVADVTKRLNLYQKLVEVRKSIQYAQKTARGFNFQYASESQILGMIRPAMDEHGVLLHTNMSELETIVMTTTRRDAKTQEIIAETKEKLLVTLCFTWINADDPEETLSTTYILPVDEPDIQDMGATLTYGHRYFFYKSLSVPTDKDDPDAFGAAMEKCKAREDGELLSKEQVEKIASLTDATRVKRICSMYAVDKLEDVENRHYDFILNSITSSKKTGGVA